MVTGVNKIFVMMLSPMTLLTHPVKRVWILWKNITNCAQLKAVSEPDMLPVKSNANDKSDSDMPAIDSDFGDRYRYAGVESDKMEELNDFF